MTAPNTSRMASIEARNAFFLYWRMWRSMFSMTTIASSTTMPVASTIPKSVRVLMEKSNALTKAKAPTNDTGIVTVGMMVLRQFWRKRKITRMTSRIASPSVFRTSRIDSRTTDVFSNAMRYWRPGGKFSESRSISARTAASSSSAFAEGSGWIPIPDASRPMKRSRDE